MEHSATRHISVLLNEVVEAFTWEEELNESRTRIFLDCTLGGGGHAEAILTRYPECLLVAFDQDDAAIERASRRLTRFAPRVAYVQRNFRELAEFSRSIAPELPEAFRRTPPAFDGILADLGLSSDQLDDGERGFSFHGEGKLDMRMDRAQSLSAERVLNDYDESALARVFHRGGMDREARVLARAVVKARPLSTTAQFRTLCDATLVPLLLRKRAEGRTQRVKNAALVPFQAVRIEVNQELDAVDALMESAPKLLRVGGRLAVISFHSLEDQAVTRAMRALTRPESGGRRLPISVPRFGKLLTPSAITPSDEEVETNPRARSARLRVFEREGQ